MRILLLRDFEKIATVSAAKSNELLMYTHKLPVPVFMPAVILANYARKTYSINGVKSTRLASTVAHIYDIDPVWFDKPVLGTKNFIEGIRSELCTSSI